jgi:hypothetical protein
LASTCNRIRNLCKQRAFTTTEHKTIMGYLEKRASRFRKNGWMGGEEMEEIIKKQQEEEGNVETDEGIADAQVSEQKAVKEVMEEGLLQPHRIPPNSKQDGIFRHLCENPNGLNNQITGNQKLGKAIDIKDELDADGLLFCEHRFNLRHRDNKNNFKQMFQREVTCRAVAANNVYQNVGRVQEGGTGMVAFGESTGFITKTGRDPYGLGRWCWTLYRGSEGQNTRVVVAYNACKNLKTDSWTTYQQQRQYFITKRKDLSCPNKLFRQHIVHHLKKWHEEGDRIILFMDHNEHT